MCICTSVHHITCICQQALTVFTTPARLTNKWSRASEAEFPCLMQRSSVETFAFSCRYLSIHAQEQKRHGRCSLCCAFNKRLNGAAALFASCSPPRTVPRLHVCAFGNQGTKSAAAAPTRGKSNLVPNKPPSAQILNQRTFAPFLGYWCTPLSKPPHCPPWRFPSSGRCFSRPVLFFFITECSV